MENSVFLAKLIGLYMVIVAVGILLNRKIYHNLMKDFSNSHALIYLGGVLALIIGLLIVLIHNVWVAGWPVIITIFGWVGLIKGIFIIIFPNSVVKLVQTYQKRTVLLTVNLVIILILGIFLIFKGYFA